MNLEKVCRMCSSEKLRVRPIFKAYRRERLLSIIKDIVRIDVSENDGLPSNICKPCATTLIRIQENLEEFRDNERKLRRRIFDYDKMNVKEVEWSSDPINKVNSTEDAQQRLATECSIEDASEFTKINVTTHFVACSDKIDQISMEDGFIKDDANSNSQMAVVLDSDENNLGLAEESNKRSSNVLCNVDELSDNVSSINVSFYKTEKHTTEEKIMDTCKIARTAAQSNEPSAYGSQNFVIPTNLGTESTISEFEYKPNENKTEPKLKTIRVSRRQRSTQTRTLVDRKTKYVGSTKCESDDSDRPKMNDYKCYICRSESLGSAKSLLEHLTIHLDRTPHTCTECKMETVILKSVRSLNYHMKMHAQPMKCQYCDRRYCDERARDYHIKTYHLGESAPCPSTCDDCGKVCKSISALKTHMRDHRLNLPCDHCEKVFHRRGKLKDHIARVHEKAQKYECNLCQRVVHSLDSYNSHLKMHTSEKTYECDICPMKFYTAGNLGLHKKIHSTNANYKPHKDWSGHYTVSEEPGSDKIYTCKLCGKSYTKTVMKINNHLKSHFKEIKCDRCDLMFVNESQLKVHYVVHTGIRQHKCEHCGKDFLHKNNLTQHLKIHRTERDYACEFCGKLFTYKEGMKAHIRNHHLRDSPYKCTHCRRKFVDNATLERHITAEHEPPPAQVNLGPPPLMGTVGIPQVPNFETIRKM